MKHEKSCARSIKEEGMLVESHITNVRVTEHESRLLIGLIFLKIFPYPPLVEPTVKLTDFAFAQCH